MNGVLRFIPSREDITGAAVRGPDYPQISAADSIEPGQVLVMDCRNQTRFASGGDIIVTRVMRRGGVGVVTDGALRDSPAIGQMPFPVFAAAASPSPHTVGHPAVDLQVPVACAEVAVYPGDILVGDAERVVCIPRCFADEIALLAAEREEIDRWGLEKVEAGAALKGTFPVMDDNALREYEAYRAKIGT